MVDITIWQLVQYIGDRKRCAIEGQAVLDAGHLITCGVVEEKDDAVTIKALCVRSTSAQEAPHELEAVLKSDSFAVKCSCKAGLSETCKHCIALLTHIHKTSVNKIPRLSCTDVAQKWGKTQAAAVCPPVPVENLCHVGRPSHQEKPVCTTGRLEALLAAAPASSLAVHLRRATTRKEPAAVAVTAPSPVDPVISKVVEQASILCGGQRRAGGSNQDFFVKYVQKTVQECVDICATTATQTGAEWDRERRLRITSSTAYQWYTYHGDWKGKVERFFRNRQMFRGSAATKHGLEFEGRALELYEAYSQTKVNRVGLVIPTLVPWLGCSPDGIVFGEAGRGKLIEVKCPAKLSDIGICEAVSGKVLQFLEVDGENVRLRTRHAYYGQVQISMAILNAKMCEFLVYSSGRDELMVLSVPRDDDFVESMMAKLEGVYFDHILPYLVKALG